METVCRVFVMALRVDTCELEREDLPRGFDVVDLLEKLGVEAVETGDDAFSRKACCVCCNSSIPCDMLLRDVVSHLSFPGSSPAVEQEELSDS